MLHRPIFGELDIFSDNCVIQNKNKITIWYIICPVVTGIFYCLTPFFGHT